MDEHFAAEHPLRILIAEDHSVKARVCTLMLGCLGYTASLACDGEKAVLLQVRLDTGVILMDLAMDRRDDGEQPGQRPCRSDGQWHGRLSDQADGAG